MDPLDPCQGVASEISELAASAAAEFRSRASVRMAEMDGDDLSHRGLFRALGVADAESDAIDRYQNVGRLLYARAGRFANDAVLACFRGVDPSCGPAWVPNACGIRPKRFEIDCLLGSGEAIEIKWRDATTDGDHAAKEAARVRSVGAAGFVPVRVMLHEPQRAIARRVQEAVRNLHEANGGHYFAGEDAYSFIRMRTGIDLEAILGSLAVPN